MKLAFVILNYGTFKETTECVQSIKKHIDILEEEYHIVIVDNGSSDDSGVELKKEYQQEKNIDVILNPENIGFAKGNNIGIRYVNEKYEPEFIVVLNSDTELFQDDFYEKISTEYKHSHFGMLGPMMLTGDGRCNDSPWKPIEIAAVERRIQELKTEKKRILNRTIYIKKIIDKIKEKIGVANWQDYLHQHLEFWKYNTDVELQGAFLVFSKEIFNYIDGFECFSNVGAFGIDGGMSTLIGQSIVSEKLSYMIIGDLAFLYDINSISIRHINGDTIIPNIMKSNEEIRTKKNAVIDTVNEIGYACIVIKTKIIRKVKKWFLK